MTLTFDLRPRKHKITCRARSAVRSETLNLANKFSQCTFSVADHYDLFSGLITIRQASWRRSHDVIPHRPHPGYINIYIPWPHRTDRETAAGKAQRYHTDLKLVYMLPIMPYTTSRQIQSQRPLQIRPEHRRCLHKTAYLATSLKLAKFSVTERTAASLPTFVALTGCWVIAQINTHTERERERD